MSHTTDGAVARLVITPNALRRHARRAQQELKALGVVQKLSSSQDFFARTLGLKNWDEAVHLAKVAEEKNGNSEPTEHGVIWPSSIPLRRPSPKADEVQTQEPQKERARTPFLDDVEVSNKPVSSNPTVKEGHWENEPHRMSPEDFEHLVAWATTVGYEAIHLQSGQPVMMEKQGGDATLNQVTHRRITTTEIRDIASTLCDGSTRVADRPLSFTWSIPSTKDQRRRFLVNLSRISFNDQGGLSLTLRAMNTIPPELNQWETLEAKSAQALFPSQGLVVVASPMGHGKTSLLGSVVRDLRDNPSHPGGRILTFEHPIQFLFDEIPTPNDAPVTMIAQTNVLQSNSTLAKLVRNGMRQNPRVLVIDHEIDADTLVEAINAANLGYTVYLSVQAAGVLDALQKLLVCFPDQERDRRWVELLNALHAVVAHVLVPTEDHRRVALHECWSVDDQARSLWNKNVQFGLQELTSWLETHCQTLYHAAARQVKEGRFPDTRKVFQDLNRWVPSSR